MPAPACWDKQHRIDHHSMMPAQREQQARRRSYVVVACTMTMVMAGSAIITPLYASYREIFGFSALTLTLIFATYILTMIPSLLIFGSLADAIGRRRVLLIATMAAIASCLLLLLAQSTAWLFAARVVNGVAVGALSGAGAAALLELGKRAKTSALVTTVAISGGGVVGILLSGVLAQYAPFPLQLCYVVYLVLMLFVLSGVFTMVEPLRPDHRRPFHPHRPRWPARHRILFLLGTAVGAVAYYANALFLSVLPSFFTVQLQTNNITLVATPVALFFLSLMMAQIVLHQLQAQRAAIIGLLLEAIGLGLMLYATSLGSVPFLLVAILVGGAGVGLATLGSLSLVSPLIAPQERGDVFGSYYALLFLCLGVAAVAVGGLANPLGLIVAVRWITSIIIVLCLTTVVALLLRSLVPDAGTA
jgi:MFS family permease